ncbi:MAG: RsiV family protein, partial [Lachnospiraceae bacterium]|nr:RsiV family protein [Lachnospiraceae bacterium]
TADRNFYLNAENKLVIVFDEYEVAPGSMGMPEFVIPEEVLEEFRR